MFGFNCIGYQGRGWNPCWMFPGPCFGFGYYGYNPGVSDGIMLGQTILSGLNGIFAGLSAHYDYGYNGIDAARIALGTAAVGTNNALLGNIIDKNTGTYAGSMMNSTYMAYANPFAANVGLTAGAIMTSPFGMPFCIGAGFYC